MRIGILGLLHESNTFVTRPTTIDNFRDAVLLTGDAIRPAFDGAHHEIGGFLAGVDAAGETAVPIFVARALPAGTIDARSFNELIRQLLAALDERPSPPTGPTPTATGCLWCGNVSAIRCRSSGQSIRTRTCHSRWSTPSTL
jgi:hypothetical protein